MIGRASYTNPDLRVWHYRDKDQVEVDVVVTMSDETWGIEDKAASTLRARDGAGLLKLADLCGNKFKRGILFYSGRNILALADQHLLAVPLIELWER